MKRTALLAALAISVGACASGYKPETATGGFSDLKLGDRLYEVRYQGNGFTRRSAAGQLLMRRCAEIALENRHRYFTIEGDVVDNAGGEGGDPGASVRIRLLFDSTHAPSPLDAMLIVKQTEELADGRLSEKAREALEQLNQQ